MIGWEADTTNETVQLMMIDGDVGGGGDDDDNDKDYNGYLMDIFPNCSEVPLRATIRPTSGLPKCGLNRELV